MCSIGIPVPPGFTISTQACKHTIDNDMEWPDGLREQVNEGVFHVEGEMNKRLGDKEDPLLLSVRSGAAVSMRVPPFWVKGYIHQPRTAPGFSPLYTLLDMSLRKN